jgi:hypothetical protein
MRKYTRFADIQTFTPFNGYEVDVGWKFLEKWIAEAEEGSASFEVNPDFQRGHVWTDDQRSKYVEFVLRGGNSARHIYWNCPAYAGRSGSNDMVLVDGLQRLTAVRRFLANEIPAFGTLYRDYKDELRSAPRYLGFRMCVNNLRTRAAVLTWYLEINDGGVVHPQEELDRVRALLEECQAAARGAREVGEVTWEI